ncbi:hypothetical protein [Vreelandella sp. EE22]
MPTVTAIHGIINEPHRYAARWGAIKDLKHYIGAELNKATEAIEEHNATLEGVLVFTKPGAI